MNQVRCNRCNKKLAEFTLRGLLVLSIKCPKCGNMVTVEIKVKGD